MRVLHIAKDLAPNSGITTYLRTVLAAQAKRGDTEVHLMTGRGTLPEELTAFSIPFVVRPMSDGAMKAFALPFLAAGIARYCRSNRIDIIHTHHRFPELAAVAASRWCGAATVATVHSLVTGKTMFSFRSNRLIAVSRTVQSMLIDRFHVPTRHITMLYNPIVPFPSVSDIFKQALRTELGILPGNRVLLFIGRHHPIKGVDILLAAFRVLLRTERRLTLLMVGDESLNTIVNEGVPGECEIIRTPPRQDVSALFQVCNVVVMPSRQEPLGYTMLEAGHAACPFIGSAVDGIAEFVTHGVEGLLFPSGDAVRLAECIRTMLDDADGAARMARSLKEKVESIPTADEYAAGLDRVYRTLVGRA